MDKKKKLNNVQDHHTLGEYQRYFSHLLRKGKLNRYPLKDEWKLDPTRQYWKITDEKNKTYYYEVPSYIKVNSTKSAYSLNRVMHRRPFRASIAIFLGAAVISITSSFVVKKFCQPHFPDVPPTPVDLDELQKKLHDFDTWHKAHPLDDASKIYSVSDLANISVANALFDVDLFVEETGYERRPLLAIGFGSTLSSGFITVKVTNAFVFDKETALEESISYSDFVLEVVPKVGRRDFFNETSNEVNSNKGVATSDVDATWNKTFDKHFTKDEYIDTVGKVPDNPFLYTITDETVLTGSVASKSKSGYSIDIKLDKVLGVVNYRKRMHYLSGKTATQFYSVNLNFTTDNDLRLISTSVNESYLVDGMFDTTGNLTTKFYYDEIPSVPEVDQPFDYSKYKA